MVTAPLVSIVTPSYNRARFLRGCIDSVRNQTYANIEHIVVDGGSTDGTVKILQSAADVGHMRFLSEPDNGMYDAVNKGVALARGEIVAYLNTDDRYLPWTVQTAVSTLVDSRADMVFGDLCVVVRAKGCEKWYLQFYADFKHRTYTHFSTIAQPTVFMRTALMRKIGEFGNGFRLIADCDYWLRCAAADTRIVHVPEMLAVQIDHPNTLRESHVRELAEEFSRLADVHGGHGVSRPSRLEKKLVNSLRARMAKLRYLRCAVYDPIPGSLQWVNFRNWIGMPPLSTSLALKTVASVLLPGALVHHFDCPLGGTTLPRPLARVAQ